MAKGRGKKFKDKGRDMSLRDANKKMKKKKKSLKIKATNAVSPAPHSVSGPSQPNASAPATNGDKAASKRNGKAKDKLERHSGFIFMCNVKTKPECFQYRVFGLPAGKKEVVEKIKAGTKLFLFDFDMKILYGVYKATCDGQMNLEAFAFGGKFPAQVKFSIYKDCLPLPESSLKHAIKDNYQGSKFEPELNARQVKDLLSMFRPCAAATAPPVAPYRERDPPRQNMYHPSFVRLPPRVDPYLAQLQHSHVAPRIGQPPVQQSVPIPQHELYGSARTMGLALPSMEHQGLSAPNDRYYVKNRHPYSSEHSAQFVQDQYPRYPGMQEMVPHDRLVGMERDYHRLPLQGERGSQLQRATVTRFPNSYPATTVPSNTYPIAATYQSYLTTATPHGPPLAHAHDVVSGRPEPSVRSIPVSSYYSFAGAKQLYY